VAKIAMHNREHVVILRPGDKGILMHTMFYSDEIRKVEEFRTDTSLVKEKELALATTLITSLEAEFEPEKYKDGYRENLKQMIAAKVAGEEIVETAPAEHRAPVVDIMEALKLSLENVKKPVRSAATAARAAAPESINKARKTTKKAASGD
jgi:DNA end-binding protein Ku